MNGFKLSYARDLFLAAKATNNPPNAAIEMVLGSGTPLIVRTKSPEFVLVTEPPPRIVSFYTLGGHFSPAGRCPPQWTARYSFALSCVYSRFEGTPGAKNGSAVVSVLAGDL